MALGRGDQMITVLLLLLFSLQASQTPKDDSQPPRKLNRSNNRTNNLDSPSGGEKMTLEEMIDRKANTRKRAEKQQASPQPQDSPKQPTAITARSRKIQPRSRPVPHASSSVTDKITGTQSSTFYPSNKNELLSARETEEGRRSDPTPDQLSREIDIMQRRLDGMKRQAGIVTPAEASRQRQPGPNPSAAFTASREQNSTGGKTARKLTLSAANELLSQPGVTMKQEVILDENQQPMLLTLFTDGMKTSRFCSPLPPPSSSSPSPKKTSSFRPSPNSISSNPKASLPNPSNGSQHSRTHRSANGSAPVVNPKMVTENGYPLQVTDEWKFPHVAQAPVQPWSQAPKPGTVPPPNPRKQPKSNFLPSAVQPESGSSTGSISTDSTDTEGEPSTFIDDAKKTSSKIANVVPNTFKRVAGHSGLRKEASQKGKGGFLAASTNRDDTTTEEIDGVRKKLEVTDELVEVVVESGDPPEGPEDNVVVNDGPSLPKEPSGTVAPKRKRKHRHKHRDPKPSENASSDLKKGRTKPAEPHADASNEDPRTKPAANKTSTGDDDPPAQLQHAESRKAMIFEEHEDSDSFDEDHICKRLQPLFRYVEYEVTINMATTTANMFALLIRLFDQLGAFK